MSENKDLNYIIRNMKECDYDQVRQIWSSVNFVMFKYANEVFSVIDPSGLFVAEDKSSGELLGVCSGVRLSPDMAFIGQYAVRPQCKGQGIGTHLWTKVMEHIGEDMNVCLFAAEAMFEKYRDRSGFTIVPEKRLNYCIGNLNCDKLIDTINGVNVVPISEDNMDLVAEYDRKVTGLDRKDVIRRLAKIKESVTAVAFSEDHQVLGFCVLSAANIDAYLIEPLYADDQNITEVLLNKCAKQLPPNKSHKVIYHFWDSHPTAKKHRTKVGFKTSSKRTGTFH